MPEDGKDKIVQLMKKTASTKPRAPRSRAGNSIDVSGNGNLVSGGDMNLYMTPPSRPKVVVQTGVGVIDAKQKAALTQKLKQWLAARNAIRRDQMTMQAAFSAMNASVGVNSYHEMTPEHYKKALAWLTRQRAILRSMSSAPVKVASFRSDMISAIKARSKQLGDLNYYRPYIAVTYGVDSLAKMSDRQLQELRAWIMQQRR